MTPGERSERARKAARARWALGATEKRRVRALYYYRRIERAIASGDVRWLEAGQRERLAKEFSRPDGRGGFLVTETRPIGASQGKPADPANCDPPGGWSGGDARADAQPAFPRSARDARKHVTPRVTRRRKLGQPR